MCVCVCLCGIENSFPNRINTVYLSIYLSFSRIRQLLIAGSCFSALTFIILLLLSLKYVSTNSDRGHYKGPEEADFFTGWQEIVIILAILAKSYINQRHIDFHEFNLMWH